MYTMSAMTDRSGLSSISGICPYWRDWNRNKVQEHTAFTSTISIKQKAQEVGYPLDGNGISWPYKSDADIANRGNVNNIYKQIEAPTDVIYYNPDFNFDSNNISCLFCFLSLRPQLLFFSR